MFYALRIRVWVVILALLGGIVSVEGVEAAQFVQIPGMPQFAKTALKAIAARFPATEAQVEIMGEIPWATVEGLLLAGDARLTKTRVELSAGSGALDLIYTDTATVPEWYQGLEPLNDYIDKYSSVYHFSDIPKNLWDQATVNGKIYAIPTGVNAHVLFYRKDLLEKAGIAVPQNFNDLLAAAKMMTTPGRSGLGFPMKRGDGMSNAFSYFLWSVGGDFFDKSWHPIFNGPAGEEALRWMKEFLPTTPADALNYWVDEVAVDLQQDRLAMAIMWASRALAMDDEKVSKVVHRMEYAPLPSKPGVAPAARSTINAWSVSRFGKNKEQAFHVVAYVAAQPIQTRIAGLQLPSMLGVMNDPAVQLQYRWFKSVLETLKTAKPFPPIPEWWQIADTLTAQVQEYLLGRASAKQALDKSAAVAEQVLREAGYYKR